MVAEAIATVGPGRHPWAAPCSEPTCSLALPRAPGYLTWHGGWEGGAERPREIIARFSARPAPVAAARLWTQTWDGLITVLNGSVAVGLQGAAHDELQEVADWLGELAGEMLMAEAQAGNWWLTWGRYTVEFVGWTRGMVEALRDSLKILLVREGGPRRGDQLWPWPNETPAAQRPR